MVSDIRIGWFVGYVQGNRIESVAFYDDKMRSMTLCVTLQSSACTCYASRVCILTTSVVIKHDSKHSIKIA